MLGLLLPASDDPRADREVFLRLLTMDDDGLRRRKTKAIALKDLHALLTPAERAQWFRPDADHPARPRLRTGLEPADRERLQHLAFDRLGYDDKLRYCDRPEQTPGPDAEAWRAINAHLNTSADSLPELLSTLTPGRWELIRRMRRHGPLPVAELPALIGRSDQDSEADLETLRRLGIVETDADGRLHVPWDEIDLRVPLAA